ncbi:uncharacterized protein LOC123303479 [Chrysoperla carnea]|uniref:uncharacterized protein LOC123303479 n=1 Tax=Chrysoperla carnea TaxID=189513 RepID=UPI001D095EB6|nr:uncharacterized protein LOC123303479 [Chrysoperla carnea]
MWKCHKCGKPVYFAERKQSLGYDWHPECLRCEECGKRLNPGQHAEHKGVPYCHVPCYGALFGPQLFGHGTRVESHKSFGQNKFTRANTGPILPRSHLESKLKVFNQFYDGRALEIRSREVNGRLVLEGALRIHWGVRGLIHLKEDDDQRTVVTVRKRNSCRISTNMGNDADVPIFNSNNEKSNLENKEITINNLDQDIADLSIAQDTEDNSSVTTDATDTADTSLDTSSNCVKSYTLPPKLDIKNMEWDELDDLLQVERKVETSSKLYQTMPVLKSSSQSSNCSPTQSSSFESPTISSDLSDDISPSDQSSSLLELNGCGTLKRIKNYEKKIEKQNSLDGGVGTIAYQKLDNINMSISQDDSWIEKGLNRSMSGPDCLERSRTQQDSDTDCDESLSQETVSLNNEHISKPRHGSTAIRRRPGARRSRTKLKRRCSINGHFYDRETSIFTPPHGSQMSVWVTSLVNTQEVINLMLEKYKVDSDPENFALFVVRDNGEQRRLKDDEYPLLVRVLLGPHEDVAKLFIFDRHNSDEVSSEVAQFLNLSVVECRAILQQYRVQEEREIQRIISKYQETKKRIKQRMEELKVRL